MFGLPPLFAHLIEIFTLLLITAALTGAGLRLLQWLRLMPMSAGKEDEAAISLSIGEQLVFGCALGYGLLAYITLAVGVLGLLYWPVILLLLAGLGIVGLSPLLAALREAYSSVRAAIASLRYLPSLFLAVVVVITAAAALIKALVPPATEDDLMYHLALPARYVAQHSVVFYPDSSYSLFPQVMEMLYTVGLLFGSDRLAVLFAYAIAILGATVAALFAKRYLANSAGGVWQALPLLTAALFLTTPLIVYILRAANTDPAQATFDMLTAYAAYLALRRIQAAATSYNLASALILAGICAGLSLGVKYNGFPIVLAVGLGLLAVLLYRRLPVATMAGLLVAYALPVGLVFGVWLLRNWLAAANPVWPLATGLFGGAYYSPADPPTLFGRTPPISLDSLHTGWNYIITNISRPPILIDGQRHSVNLGPLLLPLLLLLPFAKWRAALAWLAYLAAAYWLLWDFLFLRTSARYLTSFYLLAAILSAYAVISLASWARVLEWLVGLALAFGLVYISYDAGSSVGGYLPTTFALAPAAEQDFLADYMEDYPIIQQLAATPITSTVYVWDSQPRGYRLPRPYVYARFVPLYSGFGNPDIVKWRARLAELGITHILYHPRNPLAPSVPLNEDPYAEASQQFIKQYFGPPLMQVNGYILSPLK